MTDNDIKFLMHYLISMIIRPFYFPGFIWRLAVFSTRDCENQWSSTLGEKS